MTNQEHQALCLTELRGSSSYHDFIEDPSTVITIEELPIDEEGYTESGRYFGVGAPLFTVTFESDESHWEREVRGVSGTSLKLALADMFPRATVTL